MTRLKLLINAAIYWLDPQRGAIDALLRKVKAQDDLILTITADRQSIENENAKLWARIAELESVVEAHDAAD